MRSLIVDVETTGLGAEDEICELAFVEVDHELVVLNEFSSLIQPSVPIKPEASAASHITNEMVIGAPTLEEVLSGFPEEYFSNVLLLAHNSRFEFRMLSPHWDISAQLCTMVTARRLYPNAPNHQLQTLRYWLGLEVDGGAHRAMEDVITTYELVDRLIFDSKQSLLQMIEENARFAEENASIIQFGKHKGKHVRDLPAQYVNWLLTLDNLEPEFRKKLEEL
jgi:exodeoxyribonuclease X